MLIEVLAKNKHAKAEFFFLLKMPSPSNTQQENNIPTDSLFLSPSLSTPIIGHML